MAAGTRPARTSRIAGLAVAFVAALATIGAPGVSGTAHVSAQEDAEIGSSDLTGEASKFVPISPIRIIDTRSDADISRVFPASSFSLDPVTDTGVAAAAGVAPGDITAVVLNSTVINAGARGYATMWPTGSERLTAATNNTEFPGHTIGNLVIAPLGLERKISFYASQDVDVTLDVMGVFVASGATTAGRYVSLGPVRHSDTRGLGTRYVANEKRTVDLTTAGVPSNATGVVMNVTAINASGRGFFRVWAAGQPQPETANVNVLAAGYTAGNQVISGVTAGKVDVFTDVGADLTIDITGYFTAPTGAPSTKGLFVPFSPARLLDSRINGGPTGLNGGNKLAAGQRFELPILNRNDIPPTGVEAVALNLTAIQTAAKGFVKAFPHAATEPPTSSLNFTGPGQTVPNHAITSVNATSGSIDLLPSVATHVVVDATGYFLSSTGVPPFAGGPAKSVNPGSYVPPALGGAPTEKPYDFLFDRSRYIGSGSRPIPTIKAAWSACDPIRYALNIDLANNAQIADLITSIEEIEQYTGIDFQFAGVTSAGMNIADDLLVPPPGSPYQYLPPGADLVIGYSNAADTPDLAGGVIGVGGGLRFPGIDLMFSGFAVIDLPDLSNGQERRATTIHELGHMMGLGHVSDFDPRNGSPSTAYQGLDSNAGTWSTATLRDQLMYPTLNVPANVDFDEGDIRGLWELYGTQSCGGGGSFSLDAGGNDGGEGSGNGIPDDIDWTEVEKVAPIDDFGS